MNNLGPLAFKDEAPIYTLERQPYPERGESRYIIWVKEDGIKISSVELSQLLANVLASQVKVNDLKPSDPEANSRPSESPKLNQLIYTQVLELIGEDESIAIASLGSERDAKIMASPLMQRRMYYNQLKAELRDKAKAKYIGGDNE